MKITAAVLYQQGLPRPYAESRPLRIETVDLDGPGEGEVLVQVKGAGLCHSDLSTIDNSRPRALPTIPGHEGAGIVAEAGAGVRDLKAGDHVVFVFVPSCGACRNCRRGRPNVCTVWPQLRARQAQRVQALARAAHARRTFDRRPAAEPQRHLHRALFGDFLLR